MKMKITVRTVEKIQPGPRDVFAWDEALTGFGVRVKPSGKKSYLIQYRNKEGRSRRMTICKTNVLTPAEAREMALQKLAEVARGGDPAADRAKSRAAPTVGEICDTYLTEHATAHSKPRTVKEYRRLIGRHIKPALGTKTPAAVTRDDVGALHRSMHATPRQANLVLAVLSTVFNTSAPDITNPCRGVKRYRENARERFFSEDELLRLGTVLAEAEATGTALPGIVWAIRLLALTGCRLGEILGLRWSDVDLETGALDIRAAKAGRRIQTIGAPAIALLESIPRTGQWVVFGRSPDRPLAVTTIENAWVRLRKRARLEDARIHDLRHTVGTYAAQTGANAFMVRDMLGHKTLSMTGRYVARHTDPQRVLSDKVEGRIAGAMSGESAEVVPIGAGRK